MNKIGEVVVWAFWSASVYRGVVYIPETHLRYVRFAAMRFRKVHLVVPCAEVDFLPNSSPVDFGNVSITRMPLRAGYERYFIDVYKYLKVLIGLRNQGALYMRVPDPFRWLPFLIGFRAVTYHFVGNAVEVLRNDNSGGWASLLKSYVYGIEQRFLFFCIRRDRQARVFANGSHMSEYLCKYGVSASSVVSSTLLVEEKKPLAPLPLELRLLHVGYLRRSKNLDLLIEVMARLRRDGIKIALDIVGDGDYSNSLQESAKSRGLSDAVIFHGHIDDRRRMIEIVRSASLFVFPSLSEGSPRVVIEAMAFGAAVVSTRVGSLPSTFEHGKQIFFCNPTVDDFYEAVQNLLNDRLLIDSLRAQAYEKVWEDFTLDNFLGQVFPI